MVQALVVGGEPVAQHEQQRSQVLALVGVERGEEGVLGVALCARGVGEVLFAGRR